MSLSNGGASTAADLVQSVEVESSGDTAVVTVLTHGGKEMQYRVRTESNVDAAIARFGSKAVPSEGK